MSVPPHTTETTHTVQLQRPFDPVISFRNSQGEAARATLTSVQRRALVMEIYNPYSIVQVSEVLDDVNIRSGDRSIYKGKAVVVSLLNTGLMAVVSVALTDEWSDLNFAQGDPGQIAIETTRFVEGWEDRFRISQSYQVTISEFRAFLAETSRWIGQAEMAKTLPRDAQGQITDEVFWAMAEPLMRKGKSFLVRLEGEASVISPEDATLHRNYAQAALHPLVLRAPFVYRTFVKPLGYAGDYEMVNQLLGDPRQGSSTYIQVVNATFLRAAVAEAHRNRIDVLVTYLRRAAALAESEGRLIRILNIGCGPAVEIQRLVASDVDLSRLQFTLIDFSRETLDYTREKVSQAAALSGTALHVSYVQESVHELLKRAVRARHADASEDLYDFIYCAGLFDYLSDKVCSRLIRYFVSKSRRGARMLLTNVHASNPERHGMEHLLEWHLIYRDERQMLEIMADVHAPIDLYTDPTGVNLFAETTLGGGSGDGGHGA
ncbi:class I SAM-dependent methyltransferase [Hydrogenophaga sp. PAMC20947]|uniref:class I SAM-dependent methyltransferase n=1 Tax=Hydrogenophaga sp. PAMC20947 TaxID=2565558 RepID=UPI00109E0DEA|nr:class I SAM-dependent methyltransferase [Hydrogenophaga sp. PAMC20947]QCB48049.1 class I SAM-dependent methyltransferase [Hydrogenophaga sp. PAMC20947]